MSDKYPSLSPYNYCALNPVMWIDPNGKEIKNKYENYKEKQSFVDNLRSRLSDAKENGSRRDRWEARKELWRNSNTVNGVDNYRKAAKLIGDFEKANPMEFIRLNNLEFNGVKIDIIIGLSYSEGVSKSGNRVFGATDFSYHAVSTTTDFDTGKRVIVPTSITDNHIIITLYKGGFTLSTLANELGDADFAVSNPIRAYDDILAKTDYWNKATTKYSSHYSDYITGKTKIKPNVNSY